MTCDTLNASTATSATLTSTTGARIPNDPRIGTEAAAPGRYIVYALEELASGRHYVGVSQRTLAARVASHLSQSRRTGRVRIGGLMAALRLMEAVGQSFDTCFSARVLGRADTPAEARALERHWVEALDCRVPHGLNGMPGGSSLGGVDNARALLVTLPDGVSRTFPSIQTALVDVNEIRSAAGLPLLEAKTLYARLAAGWPIAEALGFAARQDPRALRSPFVFGTQTYRTLEAASAATGLGIAALRSRLHRAAHAQSGAPQQIGSDRRARAPGQCERLSLPWPGTDERLTAAEYSKRTGVAKATVMHRWHRARAAWPTATKPPPHALYAFLTAAGSGKRAAAAALVTLLSASEIEAAPPADSMPATVNQPAL